MTIWQMIARLFPKPKKRKPDILLLSMPSRDVKAEMVSLSLKLMYPTLMDFYQPYYYTNSRGWAEVFNYIYCEFDMPKYIAGRMDCEDFAILLKGLVSSLFGLNYFAITVGDSPMGYHGFNFYKTELGLMVIEPQTGESWEWGKRKYTPEYVLL